MSSNPRGSASAESNEGSTQVEEAPITSTERDEDSTRRRAYEICLERGSEPGRELDDWLQAERELQILRVL
jgi:DUF2934 family protein